MLPLQIPPALPSGGPPLRHRVLSWSTWLCQPKYEFDAVLSCCHVCGAWDAVRTFVFRMSRCCASVGLVGRLRLDDPCGAGAGEIVGQEAAPDGYYLATCSRDAVKLWTVLGDSIKDPRTVKIKAPRTVSWNHSCTVGFEAHARVRLLWGAGCCGRPCFRGFFAVVFLNFVWVPPPALVWGPWLLSPRHP